SVLPRIQLTRSQAEELWALVYKGRRRNPNNDADAEMAIPQFRSNLKTLQGKVARFLDVLPQEHDPVGYFLKRTYTGEVFLKDWLRPTEEKLAQLEQAWSAKHGLTAIRNSLAEFQKIIDAAGSLLSGTKPRDVAVEKLVSSLAQAWKAATGRWPKSGRDVYKKDRQSGPFADFVRAVTALLPPELP